MNGIIKVSNEYVGRCTVLRVTVLICFVRTYLQPVAVKEFNFDSSKSSPPTAVVESFKREVDMLRRVNHFNVVSLYGAQIFPRLCIVTELLKQGSLHDCIKNGNLWSHLSLENKLTILEDVLHGLLAMHNVNLVHRDIKSHNILIQANEKGTFFAKVADLGSALLLAPGEFAHEETGSTGWTAPEVSNINKQQFPLVLGIS